MRFFFVFGVILTFALLPATASVNPVNMHQELMQEFSGKAQATESILQGKDQSDWTQREIDEYLFNSMLAIYYSLNIYLREHDEHPSSPEILINSGILSPWPGNPYSDWEPMTWIPGSLEFSPGNICIQLCPPDWYSRIPPRPITYVISVFGPTIDYTPTKLKDSTPYEMMTWATKPSGEAYSTAYGRSRSPK